jgi:catechol-2,3-dioxygenase
MSLREGGSMNASLSRVILNVHDVERLSAFYQEAFALSVVEHIKSETSDLRCSSPRAGFWGACF